jgi:hypothetical protein
MTCVLKRVAGSYAPNHRAALFDRAVTIDILEAYVHLCPAN